MKKNINKVVVLSLLFSVMLSASAFAATSPNKASSAKSTLNVEVSGIHGGAGIRPLEKDRE